MPEPQAKRVWLRRTLWVAVPLLLLAAAIAFLAWPRREVLYTDGERSWPARDGLGLRSVLWDAGEPLEALGDLDQDYDPCLSADGRELYFTRGRAGEDAEIYVTHRSRDGWTEPRSLKEINTRFDEIGPALAPDGATLYFYSNRPGGEGGYDLYVSRHDGSRWSSPANLGPGINSSFNEYDPFVAPDGSSLLFASNRPTQEDERPEEGAWPATLREQRTLYDYDIYAVDLEEEAAEPRRLDAVCSAANDGQPAVSPDGKWLYFASDRADGFGGYDLWRSRIGIEPLAGLLPPENLGLPLNSAANELDPALSLEGFGLYFSSDRAEPDIYSLYYARSHEVYRMVRTRRLAVGRLIGRLSWPLIGLILALAGLALTLLALVKLRRRPGLLATAMMASLVVHLVALSLFTLWQLSMRVAELTRSEERFEVAIAIPGLAESELSSELRTALTDLARLDTAQFAVEKTEMLTAPPEPDLREPEIALAIPEPQSHRIEVIPPENRPEEPDESPRWESAPVPVPELLPPEPIEPMRPREVRPAERLEPPAPQPIAIALRREAPVALRDAPTPKPSPEPMAAEPKPTPMVPTLEQPAPKPTQLDLEVEARLPLAIESPAVPDVRPAKAEVQARPVLAEPEPAPEDIDTRPLATTRSEPPSGEPAVTVPAPVPAAPTALPPTEAPLVGLRAQGSPTVQAAVIKEEPASRGAAVPAAETLDIVSPAVGPVEPRAPVVRANGTAEAKPPARALPAVPRPRGPVALAPAGTVEGPDMADEMRLDDRAVGPTLVEAPDAAAAPPSRIFEVVEGEPVVRRAAVAAGEAAAPVDLARPAAVPAPREARRAPAPTEAAPRGMLAPGRAATAEPPLAVEGTALEPVVADPVAPAEETLLASTALVGSAVGTPEVGEAVRVAILPPPAPIEADVTAPPKPLPLKEIYSLRTKPRDKTIEKLGGTPETEEAVRQALVWLARHQNPDGRWDVDEFMQNYEEGGKRADGRGSRGHQDIGVTALAALSFIGAGHTHIPVRGVAKASEYAETVRKAIDWMLAGQKENGDLRQGGQMYGQAIATMVLCEAYTMTGDERLAEPIRRAVRFIIDAQNPGLGWRYEPRDSSNDTSIVGWQIMALKSAEIAGFQVPPKVYRGGANWLDKVRQGKQGGLYTYQSGNGPSPAMTAEGFFTEQYIDFKPHTPRTAESVAYLLEHKPRWNGSKEERNLYYWYYATMSLHQLGGPEWNEWNAEIRKTLVESQRRDGPFVGSWDPNTQWGGYGGRVYSTATAALTLEVYYRYLPFYALRLGESAAAAGAAGGGSH